MQEGNSHIRILSPHGDTENQEQLKVQSPELFHKKKLKYNGGPVIGNAEVFTIFIGSGWMREPNHPLTLYMNSFFSAYLTSPSMEHLHQYSTDKIKIGHGSLVGSLSISIGGTSKSINDTVIQSLIQKWIKSEVIPKPNANTIYFVFLDEGISVVMGERQSCTDFCAYHGHLTLDNSDIYYAAIPFPSCVGCNDNLSKFDALTVASSHELCEMITDPIPGTGWYNDKTGEVSDMCAWQYKDEGGYKVQLTYSNNGKHCI